MVLQACRYACCNMSQALSCNGKSVLILVDFQRGSVRRDGFDTVWDWGRSTHSSNTFFTRGSSETAEDPHAFLRYPKRRFIKIYLEKRCISVITTFPQKSAPKVRFCRTALCCWFGCTREDYVWEYLYEEFLIQEFKMYYYLPLLVKLRNTLQKRFQKYIYIYIFSSWG